MNETTMNATTSNVSTGGNASAAGNQTTYQECVSNFTWSWAQQNNAILLYAYLQNHPNAVQELFNYCQANATQQFGNTTLNQTSDNFLHDFGNLNATTAPPLVILNVTTVGPNLTNVSTTVIPASTVELPVATPGG